MRSSRPEWLTAANAISVARIPLALLFLVADGRSVRIALLACAALSDFLDGWVARRRGQSSRAGALIDPAADKFFLVVALLSLARHGAVGVRGLFVLLARDVATVAGFLAVWALRLPVRLQSRFPGKVVTTLQLATVLVLTAFPALATPAILAVGAATIWAVFDYTSLGIRSLRAPSSPR